MFLIQKIQKKWKYFDLFQLVANFLWWFSFRELKSFCEAALCENINTDNVLGNDIINYQIISGDIMSKTNTSIFKSICL